MSRHSRASPDNMICALLLSFDGVVSYLPSHAALHAVTALCHAMPVLEALLINTLSRRRLICARFARRARAMLQRVARHERHVP